MVLGGIFGGFVAGGLFTIGLRWSIGRRCLRLEIGLADMQRVILSLKGVKYSEARWQKRDQEIAEMEAIKNTAPANQSRFDNDFMSGKP